MSQKMMLNCLKSSLICGFLLLFHPAIAQKDSATSKGEFKIFDSLFSITLKGDSYEGDLKSFMPLNKDVFNKTPDLTVKNGNQELYLTQQIYHRTSSDNFLKTVLTHLHNGNPNASNKKEFTEFITQDKVQLVIFSPERKKGRHTPRLFKGLFIRSREGFVYLLSTVLNAEGKENISYFDKIISEAIKSIRQIRPDTFYSSQKHPVNFPNGKTLLFRCPKNFYIKEVISKYQPVTITKICDLSVPKASVITINLVDSISFNKVQTKSSFYQKGELLNRPVTWYRFNNNSKNILLFTKVILNSSEGTEHFFLVVTAANKKEIEELMSIAKQITLIN